MQYNTNGLTDEEVLISRKKNGSNEIDISKKNGFFRLVLESFGDPIIKILLVVLGFKTIILFKSFDWYETIGILIAIFLATFISSISEYGSEKSFERLKEEASMIKVKVKRNNTILLINSDELVVGDIVLLETGDKIPADGVIIFGEIYVDESTINGESREVLKYSNELNNKETSFLHKGTVVCSKHATMYVTAVGLNTTYGKLSKELVEESKDSPLRLRLKTLSKTISKYGYIGAFLVSFSYLFSVIFIHNNFNIIFDINNLLPHLTYALTIGITVIVVAVPEGLPMMITLVLSSNMKRMLKHNVLVRKLVGIETAGNLNILFTDKTGTLTKGNLSVNKYVDSSLNEYFNEENIYNTKNYNFIKRFCIYNNASINDNNEVIGGNSTDKAIRMFIKSSPSKYIVEKEVEFNSINKYSSITVNGINYIKGAPEIIINKCNKYLDKNGQEKYFLDKKEILNYIRSETKKGKRIITISYSKQNSNIDIMNNMVFAGLFVLKDEIRDNIVNTVEELRSASIKVIMVTGDNKETALSIARETGIYTDGIVISSNELQLMTDEQVIKILPKLQVVARSMPSDKSRLVRLAQKENYVVGMTGDGVNDAPALKKADVGFAMGSGTEVAKEASDIIILDNNLVSIRNAILYGRTIFKSIRKFIIFQLTVNMCAVVLSIIGPFIGIDSPITVIQMLWINMVMDTLAGIAFAFEPPLNEYLKEKPKRKQERIINKYMKNSIIFTGTYSSILCVIFLKSNFIYNIYNSEKNLLTAFFGLFIFISLFNSFNARTTRTNIFADIKRNKIFLFIIILIAVIQVIMIYYGKNIFRTTSLTIKEFYFMIILSLTVIPFDILRKIILKKKSIQGDI